MLIELFLCLKEIHGAIQQLDFVGFGNAKLFVQLIIYILAG